MIVARDSDRLSRNLRGLELPEDMTDEDVTAALLAEIAADAARSWHGGFPDATCRVTDALPAVGDGSVTYVSATVPNVLGNPGVREFFAWLPAADPRSPP